MALSLFTPRQADGTRLAMQLDAQDIEKVRGRGRRYRVMVTDQATGRRYLVRDAACEFARCHCDSVIVKEVTA